MVLKEAYNILFENLFALQIWQKMEITLKMLKFNDQ